MSDWQPQVVRIEQVVNHPNADVLDVVTVLGDYPVIVKRDEFKVNDLAAYIPIDSIVPDVQSYYFLCPKQYEKYEENGQIKQRQVGPKYPLGEVPEKYRIIKAKKIRDVYSQGMLVGLPDPLPNTWPDSCHQVWRVGESVVEALELKKWEEEVDDYVGAPKLKGKNAASPPKGWSIPFYDIDGLRKYISCLKEDEEIVLTEKINGSNSSFCHDGETFWIKSRNFYKKPDPDDSWVDAAIRYDLENKLKNYPMLVFFAELYGQVKGFRYDLQIQDGKALSKLCFFDIYDVKTGRYLDYDICNDIINKLELMPAPELYRGLWKGKELMYPYAEGLTTLGGKHIREGFVLRTVKERYEPKLNSRMQVKLVGEGYNLQK